MVVLFQNVKEIIKMNQKLTYFHFEKTRTHSTHKNVLSKEKNYHKQLKISCLLFVKSSRY